MLKLLRRSVKSLPAKILLGLLIASFAVWGIGDIFTGRTGSAVATVGETEVPAERFAESLTRTQRLLSQQQRTAITLADLRQAGLAEATLAGLVRDAAIAEEMDRLGIAIPTEAVREAILANPSFQDGQGAFSQFLYQSRLNGLGYDPQRFELLTRELLGQQVLVDAVAPGLSAAIGVGEMIAAHRGEERTVEAVRLTPDAAPDPGTPGDAALAAFFEANQDRFVEPQRRWGSYLHTDLEALARDLTPGDDEVRAEYDANIARYASQPTRDVEQIVFDDEATAREAAERVASGNASFVEIAAEQNVSMADLSLGTVAEGDLPAASSEAVFGVTEPGVVGPVDGPFGPILLNVTAVDAGGTVPLEDVADDIRRQIALRRAQEEAVQRANAIDDARAAGASLAQVAEQTGLELVRFQGLDAEGGVSDGAPPPLADDPDFLAEVNAAMDGEERDVIQLSDGSYALVMVERIVESHVPELSEVRDRVVAAWQDEQRLQALETRAADLAAQVAGGSSLADIAAEAGLGSPFAQSFTRQSAPPTLALPFVEAVFDAEPGDPVVGRSRDGDAVLLAVVDEVTPLQADMLAERAAAVEDVLADSLTRDLREYFGRAVEERHGATVDRAAIDYVFDQLGQSGGLR